MHATVRVALRLFCERARGGRTCAIGAVFSRAKIVYERLINVTDDTGLKDALGFLMTREIAHQKSFEKALYAIEPNFLPRKEEFANVYYNMSQGDGDLRGPWNSGDSWEFVSKREEQAAVDVDGGDGMASVKLSKGEQTLLTQAATRTLSHPDADPATGADLGAGPGPRGMGSTKKS